MTFQFLVDPSDQELDCKEINLRADEYLRYLESVKDVMPKGAFEFATGSCHWNVNHVPSHKNYEDFEAWDRERLHDSWLEFLTIGETYPEENPKERRLSIIVRLLGPYHDRWFEIDYLDVKGYDLSLSQGPGYRSDIPKQHGDWLDDEVRLSETNSVIHEVVFHRGGRWMIECADIQFTSWERKP